MSPVADPRTNTKSVAGAGLLSALAYLFLVLAAASPTAKLSLYVLASFVIYVAADQLGRRYACLVYAASTLLALIYPGPLRSLNYVLYFGLYTVAVLPLIKSERFHWLMAMAFRVTLGTILLSLLLGIYIRLSLPIGILTKIPTLWLFPLTVIPALAYDLVLALLIQFYERRIAPWLTNRSR